MTRSECQRLSALAYNASRQANKSRSLFGNSLPKRYFNQHFDRTLERLLDKLPQGNIGYAIVGLNTLIYGLWLIWPSSNRYLFLNHFTFSRYGMQQGYIHSLITNHFCHTGFIQYALESVFVFLFCTHLGMMFGPLQVAKTVLLSMALGSMFMFT